MDIQLKKRITELECYGFDKLILEELKGIEISEIDKNITLFWDINKFKIDNDGLTSSRGMGKYKIKKW